VRRVGRQRERGDARPRRFAVFLLVAVNGQGAVVTLQISNISQPHSGARNRPGHPSRRRPAVSTRTAPVSASDMAIGRATRREGMHEQEVRRHRAPHAHLPIIKVDQLARSAGLIEKDARGLGFQIGQSCV